MRVVKPKRPAPVAATSSGTTSPLRCGTWAMQARMKAPTRLASKVAARRGLPMKRISERTTSSSILSMASAAALSHSMRLAVVACWCLRNAACACLTAASTTSASDSSSCDMTLSSVGQTSGEKHAALASIGPPTHGISCGLVMTFPPYCCWYSLDVLALAQRDIAQRARREQLLELDAAIGEPVLVHILQQRLDRRPVRLDAVGIPVRPDDLFLLLDQRLQPSRADLGRTHVGEHGIGVPLCLAQRLVHAHRHPGIALVDVAADHHRMHDRIDLGPAIIVLLHLRVVREQPLHLG